MTALILPPAGAGGVGQLKDKMQDKKGTVVVYRVVAGPIGTGLTLANRLDPDSSGGGQQGLCFYGSKDPKSDYMAIDWPASYTNPLICQQCQKL